ncbi:MAG TPA: EVE domain-containing protein [Anaeromyxobacteraceae bacterium]|nr:EVE domain-containing protein [Anaeromyxobacteraceae bacterium]
MGPLAAGGGRPYVSLVVAHWLLKTEPGTYSFEDLLRERITAWTGVANRQAQANLRAMREGDRALVYHSGEKRAVGVAEVVRAAYPDPTAGGGDLVCVDVRAVEPLPAPVPLDLLRQERAFAGSPLLRQGRLSVVPLSQDQWRAAQEAARRLASTPAARRS